MSGIFVQVGIRSLLAQRLGEHTADGEIGLGLWGNLLAIGLWSLREPLYAGKTVTEWLDNLVLEIEEQNANGITKRR